MKDDLNPEEETKKPKKRVGLTVFGSILFFLGMLNVMFYTKASIPLPKFYLFLIVAGIVIFAIGSWRDRKAVK